MTDTVPVFTIGSFECRVVPDGVATYEKETLYSDLPPEELEPSGRGLLDEQVSSAFPTIRCWCEALMGLP